jgi:hypothetical protein
MRIRATVSMRKTHGNSSYTRQGRTVHSSIGQAGATTARFQIARRVDAFVDGVPLGSLDRTSGPSDGTDVSVVERSSSSSARANLSGRDTSASADLEAGVACKVTRTCSCTCYRACGETVGRDGVGTPSSGIVDIVRSLAEEVVQENGDGVTCQTDDGV